MQVVKPGFLRMALMICLLACAGGGSANGQTSGQLVRIARLVIDSAQLERYTAELKVEIETSLRIEPGVLTLYAVSEKLNPTHITLFETYASEAAYKSHIQTPHFKKYKAATLSMVKSLELVDVRPLFPGVSKPGKGM